MTGKIKIIEFGAIALASMLFALAAAQSTVSEQNGVENMNVNTENMGIGASGRAEALVANASAPEFVKIQFLAQLPKVSPEEQKSREEILKKTHLPGPRLNQGISSQITPLALSGQTNVTNIRSDPNITIFTNSTVGGQPPGYKSTVDEPSVANSGNYVFYTGNWYAARSTDGGSTFSHVDPFADMPNFCCDQDVLYDKSRDIFIWYRQYIADVSGVNFFRLGISNDTANWYFYNVYPTNVNSAWTNQEWDYPRLALSNNYLYIASNMFNSTAFTRTALLRFPLDALKNHTTGFSYNYISWTSNFNFAPVQGASGTIYWGTHNSVSSFRLFSWDESSTSFNWYDRTIPAWSSTSRGSASCLGPDGYNWCARTDHRVLSGWVANGTIGFFWNVKQDANFPYPYVNAATFNESTKNFTGRPYIWNPSYAFMYGDAAPDNSGHLGVSVFWGGGSFYPSHAVGISDSMSGAPPPWEIVATMNGTNGPSNSMWGDYLRARPYDSSDLKWAATGYTLQGGNTGAYVDPRYFVFGRAPPPPGAPAITGFAPSSPVSDIAGAPRTFNITANQTVNVTWLINSTSVQTNFSVTDASYTNSSSSPGVWNVTAIAANGNGTASHTWFWNVTQCTVGISADTTPMTFGKLFQGQTSQIVPRNMAVTGTCTSAISISFSGTNWSGTNLSNTMPSSVANVSITNGTTGIPGPPLSINNSANIYGAYGIGIHNMNFTVAIPAQQAPDNYSQTIMVTGG